MTPFTTLTGTAMPMPQANVDTDIILPARFLLLTAKTGLGRHAFHDWRFAPDGTPRDDCALNDPFYAGSQILVGGENFGCGSSREQAPWALADLGLRCIIAPSFGDIFATNCVKNGILPLALPADRVALLMADAAAGRAITIDLVAREIATSGGPRKAFSISDRWRDALINGWDEISLIKATSTAAIARFEAGQRTTQPWLWQGDIDG